MNKPLINEFVHVLSIASNKHVIIMNFEEYVTRIFKICGGIRLGIGCHDDYDMDNTPWSKDACSICHARLGIRIGTIKQNNTGTCNALYVGRCCIEYIDRLCEWYDSDNSLAIRVLTDIEYLYNANHVVDLLNYIENSDHYKRILLMREFIGHDVTSFLSELYYQVLGKYRVYT